MKKTFKEEWLIHQRDVTVQGFPLIIDEEGANTRQVRVEGKIIHITVINFMTVVVENAMPNSLE